jgi:hypothetical protein
LKPESDPRTAPTIIKRLKDDLIPRAKDKRLGTVLGLMHLEGILSEVEVEAGFRYAEDVGAYERTVTGAPRRHCRSVSYDGGFQGRGDVDLPNLEKIDPEAADKIRRKLRRQEKSAKKRYDRAQMYIPHLPILISAIVEEVCCNDRPVHSLHHPMLKKILRTLAENCYGLVQAGEKQTSRHRSISRKVDAALVASGAVEALNEWFKRRAGNVTSFRLAVAQHCHAPLGISGYGQTQYGEVLEHTIRLRRSGLMAEAINAQLLKAAVAKGWSEATITAAAPPIHDSE